MAPVNGSTENYQAQFEGLRNEFSTKLARASLAMREASEAAETLSNLVARVDARLFLAGGAHYQSYATDGDASKSKKRKADHDEEGASKKKRGPKEKKPKDKDAPKRPPSAYLLYQNEIRKFVKGQNPSLPNTELLRIISKQWEALVEEKKKPYIDRHEKLKAEYDTVKTEYESKNASAGKDLTVTKKQSVTSVVKPAPKSPKEVDEGDDDDDDEPSGDAASAASESPSSATSSESSNEEDDDEETPEPPKKKHKAGVKAPTPPPVKPAKDKKKDEKPRKKRDS